MMMEEQVFLRASSLAGELGQGQQELLRAFCGAAGASLAGRLKQGLTPQDCEAEFVLAASLYALAGFYGADASQSIQQLKAGDLTIYRDGVKQDARVRNLQNQAWEILRPFLSDGFSFAGV